MSFAAIDAALPPWLARHGLFIETVYRDEPVRAVTVVDDAGDIYTIWFTPRAGETEIRAQYWPRKRADRRSWSGMYPDDALTAGMEEAYGAVVGWIEERGHTRTPA